ncbi:MAG: HPF/RaiA family ribosome-associated protein [Polyangiaceae bacterium]|jgi:ribosome-associated translation inhibitor RaiA|nr:HPF/RaiA family ribosome-associated protein [Polyangiaceae bacterium]
MHVQVRLRGLDVPDVVREAIGRRIHFALGRFGGRLRSAVAFVVDENGPRGGIDKRCRVELRLRDGGSLIVERSGDRVLATVDETLDRTARALVRHLERPRGGRSAPATPAAPRLGRATRKAA